MSKSILSFEVDEKTLATIELLRQQFKSSSSAEVIQRALALAKVAAASTDSNSVVTLSDGHDKQTKVKIDS